MSVLSDLRGFLLSRPEAETVVRCSDPATREEYSRRIAMRMGIDVRRYDVLNIHRIGIEVPVRFAFEQLREWSGESRYWPNHLATVESIDPERRHIEIVLAGRATRWLRRHRLLPRRFGRLFDLTASRVEATGDAPDDARYVLYACSGGYPIGIFAMLVRSPLASLGESAATQLFFCVSFDFYGRKAGPFHGLFERFWEAVHNRATANILCRFKRRCEGAIGERDRSTLLSAHRTVAFPPAGT